MGENKKCAKTISDSVWH